MVCGSVEVTGIYDFVLIVDLSEHKTRWPPRFLRSGRDILQFDATDASKIPETWVYYTVRDDHKMPHIC
jgi:hypothetical protein